VTIHERLGNPVLLLGLVGAAWALENAVRRRVAPALRTYLLLTWLLIVVQALVGLILVLSGHRPQQGIHWFYGAALLIALPAAWSFAGRGDERREAVALMCGSLAVFLFAIRAVGTG
jgi:heme A synthase